MKVTSRIVSGPEALQEFRDRWTGQKMLSLLKQHGRKLLINWPVGVGKSYNIDDVIETAVNNNFYDLVVALMPRRDVIQERRWVLNKPEGIKTVKLRRRPKADCDRKNDQWAVFEKNNLGIFGRYHLCKTCHHYRPCKWRKQYGHTMKGARVIYGSQVLLERDPQFISRLKIWSGAQKVLTIIDESNFFTCDIQKKITQEDLERYLEVLKRL